MREELVDQLAELARSQRPAVLSEEDAGAMIASVLAMSASKGSEREASTPEPSTAGPRQSKGRSWARVGWAVAMAASVLLALAIGNQWGEANGVTDERPLRAELATGDVITAMPGARFELRRVDPESRQIAVHEGVALFDVQPLADGERFEVVLPHARVYVRGTVFSVDARDDSVRVYEGEVEIVSGGRSTFVRANGMWRGGQELALEAGPLADVAGSAVDTRSRLAEAVAASNSRAGLRLADAPVPRANSEDVEEVEAIALDETNEPSPPTSAVEDPPARAAERVRSPSRRTARRWLALGQYERALSAARAQGWALLEADALRALGRHEAAANAYDVAETASPGEGAAFAAARIRFRRLDDAEGALRSLESSSGEAGLAERELGLRAQLLQQLGRRAESEAAAETYLRSYPEGGLRAWMRSVLDAEHSR